MKNTRDESKISKKNTGKNAGITLIALVITIIVLLILAGISIATLYGDNGVLTQASKASENTKSASAKEKVQTEVLGSLDETGKLDKEKFKENLKQNLKVSASDITENSDGTITVILDGYKITVNVATAQIIKVAKAKSNIPASSVQPGVKVSKTEKNNFSDGTDFATIPEGFTVDEVENLISDGLVVHGPDKANGDNGSEFVWVPVPDINVMSQCSTAGGNCNLQLDGDILKCTTHNSEEIVGKVFTVRPNENYESSDGLDIYGFLKKNINKYNTVYKPYGKFNTEATEEEVMSSFMEPTYLKIPENISEEEKEYGKNVYSDDSIYNKTGLTLKEMQDDYKNMATSVAKYGGFYVGRYETSLSDATDKSSGIQGSAQSKKGVMPTSSNDVYLEDKSISLNNWWGHYGQQNKIYTGENNSVESSMIWGSQYDRILGWINEGTNGDKNKLGNKSIGNRSMEYNSETGLFEGCVITGNDNYEADKINNIRDLNGNMLEWTMEASEFYGTCRTIRINGDCVIPAKPMGGSYVYDSGSSNLTKVTGSRMTLYVK